MRTFTETPGGRHNIILLAVFLLAIMINRLDRKEYKPREAFEQFLEESAARFLPENKSIQGTDQPGMAALMEFYKTVDPQLQRIPVERLAAANRELTARQLKATSYQLTWAGTSASMGGRTRTIMWDPNDPAGKKVWAGGVTGGLWSNPDITSEFALWQPVSDLWPNLTISCMAYDPLNPMVFYIGTGESQTALVTYRESSGKGVGIWKTTDGGQNFTLLPSTADFAYITKIVVRNENGIPVVYAGVVSGVYKGLPWQSQPSDGLYRSADGGSSWQQVLPGINTGSEPYAPADVQIGPNGRLFVGTIPNLSGEGGATILWSDAGTSGSWTEYTDFRTIIENDPLNNKPYRVVIAPAPSDPQIVYAAISAGTVSSTTNPVYKGYYMLKSVDGGITWNEINTPDGSGDWANLAWHAMDLAVDPNNPATVYAGGLDMWKTVNSGSSWQHLSDWSLMYSGGGDDYIHADQHQIAYKPGSSSVILFGTDGGVFYTETGNMANPAFQERNLNFNTLQFYTCAMHPGSAQQRYLGGLQDNGTLLYSGSPFTINDMITGGDGAYCFWDQDEDQLYLTSYYYNRYSIFEDDFQVSYIDNYSGVFINPADYHHDRNVLYANAVDLWGGKANKILRVANIPQNGNGSFISTGTSTTAFFSAVKVSPYSLESNTKLFLGTSSGRLFKLNNAQAIPQTAEIGSPSFPAAMISCIAVGGSEDTLMVTFSNYGVSSIWQTCNGGTEWREVEGDLPDIPVRWALYHPQNPNQAMIATELGVWTTSSLQAQNVLWQPQINGMSNVRVDMLTLRSSDNTVLAASHGRGLFTTTFTYDLSTSVPSANGQECHVFSIPGSGRLNIDLPDSYNGSVFTVRLFSLDGRTILAGNVMYHGKDTHFQLPSGRHGIFLVEVKSGKMQYTGKIIL